MATKGPEHKVKEIIKEQLKSLGEECWWFMPASNGYGRAGIHDFVGCYKGRAFAIEAKAGKGVVSPHQHRELTAARDAGAFSQVIRGAEEAACVADRLRTWVEQDGAV